MPLTECRECGREVSTEAAVCPHCGVSHPDTARKEAEREKGRKTLLAGWICFGLGLITMIVMFALPLIYGPLFFAAFVVSIVVIVQGRAFAGIGLLLSTTVVPVIAFFGLLYLGLSSWAEEQDEAVPASEAYAQLRVEGVSARRSGSSMYCAGTVRNAGSKPVKTLLIITEWVDRSGNVVASGRVFAVPTLELLKPGESADFEDQRRNDPAMTDCRADVFVGS